MSTAPGPTGTPPRTAAVILAGGAGTRVGAESNKVLVPLAGVPVLVHSVRTVLEMPGIHRLVVVVRADERDAIAEALSPHLGRTDAWLVTGGAERHDSEWRGLQVLRPDIEADEIDVVAIHDAARPLADVDLWQRTITEAASRGAAIPVAGLGPLVRRDGRPAPSGLVGVQTPQAFRAGPLLAAHTAAARDDWRGTDTAAVIEQYAGADVAVVGVPSSARNLKVTYPEDLAVAERLLH